MKFSFRGTNEKLEDLPHLRRAMNREWLEQFEGMRGWEIANPVARWLVDGSSTTDSYLLNLDSVVATVGTMKGGNERIRKLFQAEDLSNKWSTLVELHMGAWLQGVAHSVEYRSGGGPDLLVKRDDACGLTIEVKAFQQDAFWSGVQDRLLVLGRNHELHPRIRVDHEGMIPTRFEHEQNAVNLVLQCEADRLNTLPQKSGQWRTYSSLGLSVRWRKELGGSVIEPATAEFADPYGAFKAAFFPLTSRGKAKEQIKSSDAVIVCFTRHRRDVDFYVLEGLLNACDSDCQQSLYKEVPGAIRELNTLASVMCIAVSLDQISPYMVLSLELPNACAEVKERWARFRSALPIDASMEFEEARTREV